jgi:ATP-dependent protease ClpP protease subunit
MRVLLAALMFLQIGAASAPRVAHLELHDQINLMTAGILIGQIEESQTADSIILDIDTPGGNVGAGWDIVKAIEASKVPVHCIVSNGMAASMGSIVLQACTTRSMVEGISVIMVHSVQISGVSGTPDDIQKVAEEMKVEDDRLLSYEVRRAKISKEFLKGLIPGYHMLWISPQQALKWGMIDEILPNYL